MKKIIIDYDEVSGNIYVNGFTFWIGQGLQLPEAASQAGGGNNVVVPVTERQMVIEKASSTEELIELREAGLL